MKQRGLFASMVIGGSFFLWSGCYSLTANKSIDSSKLTVTTTSKLQADVNVDVTKQLTGTVKRVTVLGFIDVEGPDSYIDGVFKNDSFFGSDVDDMKAAAAFRAVTNYNNNEQRADVLVAPQYVVRKTTKYLGIYREITATATGFPGRITRIRNNFERPASASPASSANTMENDQGRVTAHLELDQEYQ